MGDIYQICEKTRFKIPKKIVVASPDSTDAEALAILIKLDQGLKAAEEADQKSKKLFSGGGRISAATEDRIKTNRRLARLDLPRKNLPVTPINILTYKFEQTIKEIRSLLAGNAPASEERRSLSNDLIHILDLYDLLTELKKELDAMENQIDSKTINQIRDKEKELENGSDIKQIIEALKAVSDDIKEKKLSREIKKHPSYAYEAFGEVLLSICQKNAAIKPRPAPKTKTRPSASATENGTTV